MARRSDTPTKTEITEKISKHETDMDEQAEEMDKTVGDFETVQSTLEGLELSGTSEAAESIEQSIDAAGDVSVGEFEQESRELEQIQDETRETESELDERGESTSDDAEKMSDAAGRIDSESVTDELVRARDAALQDVEFLNEHSKRAEEASEQSQRIHDEYASRIATGRSG